ncbi:MAG: MoaD/ThiS family protein [Actinomycetota bacterium]
MPRVRVFASLRDLAGERVVDVPGGSVEELLRAAGDRYGAEFESIARVGSVVVNGERADPRAEVSEEDDVAFLPPFSGGAGDPASGNQDGERTRGE